MAFHDGDVDGIPRRQRRGSLDYLTGPKDVHFVDSKNLIDNVENQLERRTDRIALLD